MLLIGYYLEIIMKKAKSLYLVYPTSISSGFADLLKKPARIESMDYKIPFYPIVLTPLIHSFSQL